MNVNSKIVVTGSAGLVGQNLIIELKNSGYKNIVAIDKHHENIQILRKLHSEIEIIEADLSEIGEWEKSFENAEVVIILHAQIGAKTIDPFIKNNITATEKVLEIIKKYKINYMIHISSSVVNSKANDFYTTTKKAQEKLVLESGINYTVLRPTLMFGWFDRKHLGWLSRFMEKVPFFPIPGHGKYIRQPLYERDFAKIIVSLLQKQEINKTFNITGKEEVFYIDIIREIKKAKNLRTPIISIPYFIFYLLMEIYALFSKNPPFTTQQLKALVADDHFELINWWEIFNVKPTSFKDAINETFNDEKYSKYVLEF